MPLYTTIGMTQPADEDCHTSAVCRSNRSGESHYRLRYQTLGVLGVFARGGESEAT
jgi:hypothetical protein